MAILDQHGNPIKSTMLVEPQTASIALLQHTWRDVNLAQGLSPERITRLFAEAERGNIAEQALLFEDMLERDAHLYAEMDKRTSAPGVLDWTIVPPRHASAAEKKLAAYADEVLRDLADFEDVLKAMMQGVGHGFSALEITWQFSGGEWLPAQFDHRPHDWFQLSSDRRRLTLRDGSMDGADLIPLGWITHLHGLPKTGYLGRFPLYRVLAWPFLYKLYGIGDFAEFLEIYGLPIIIGKYPQGTKADQQKSLQRAVMSLARDARAVMPADMAIEVETAAMGGGAGHLELVAWADKAQSKAILGGTLTSQADGKTATNALGNVHQEVRRDIRSADCRQLAGTLTRDLIYPLLALNKGGMEGLRRCPRFVFDTGEAEDLAMYAESLPKLVGIRMQIPARYAHDKLRIPLPEDGEAVLSVATPAPAPTPSVAAASQPSPDPAPVFTPKQQEVEALGDALLGSLGSPVNAEAIRSAIMAASGPADLEHRLAALMAGQTQADFSAVLSRCLFAADVLGYVHAQG